MNFLDDFPYYSVLNVYEDEIFCVFDCIEIESLGRWLLFLFLLESTFIAKCGWLKNDFSWLDVSI